MQSYLLFRLYGALCSWGDIAVGEYRPSSSHPTRSAVLGLVAAALGIDRADEERQQTLFAALGYAVCIDLPGTLVSDYHTAQVPTSGGRSAQPLNSRYEELTTTPKHKLNTILSKRDYLCDAVYTACLWRTPNATLSLHDIAKHLRQPVFTLYLGRKSCPLALPLAPQIVEAATLREALTTARFPDDNNDVFSLGKQLPKHAVRHVYWEHTEHAGIQSQHEFTRRDAPEHRTQRLFAARTEQHGTVDFGTIQHEEA